MTEWKIAEKLRRRFDQCLARLAAELTKPHIFISEQDITLLAENRIGDDTLPVLGGFDSSFEAGTAQPKDLSKIRSIP